MYIGCPYLSISLPVLTLLAILLSEINRGRRGRNDSSGRLSNSRGDDAVRGIRAFLVLRHDTTDHRAIDNRDSHTIRGRARPVW